MQALLIAKLIILLCVANGTPVLLNRLLGARLAQPIDYGFVLCDGRRLFGPSKTIRGAVVSVTGTTLAAPLLSLDAAVGILVGAAAMLGDLFSSFLKRRLNFAPSSRATGLDQIPESLFPLLACSWSLSLHTLDILVGVAIFSIGAVFLSPIFHRLGIRDRPF
jgi:CDP-diglyceride synthetase